MYSKIPFELKLHIFSFLNRKELGCLASVSKAEKALSETDDLWINKVISRELMQKMAISAKELSKYTPLLKPNGNYAAHLLQDKISLARINEQLNHRFPRIDNPQYQLTVITSPSGTMRNLCKAYKNNEGSLSFLGALKKLSSLDVFQGYIQELNLVCHHVDTYFNMLFQDYVITTYAGSENSQKALANSASVIIFSNDAMEINKICIKIKKLAGNKPMPFIFIGCTEKSKLREVNTIEFEITDILEMDAYNSNLRPLLFWQILYDRLTALSTMSAMLNCPEEKRCLVM